MARPLGVRQIEAIKKIHRDGKVTVLKGLYPHWFVRTGLESIPGTVCMSLRDRGILVLAGEPSYPADDYVLDLDHEDVKKVLDIGE